MWVTLTLCYRPEGWKVAYSAMRTYIPRKVPAQTVRPENPPSAAAGQVAGGLCAAAQRGSQGCGGASPCVPLPRRTLWAFLFFVVLFCFA